MVQHPLEYPWSSDAANALGRADSLLTPHALYLALDNLPERRQASYRALFQVHIDNKTLEDIRQATQKGWALGNDRFKEEIGQLLKRRACPLPRGGDHRSVAFREGEGWSFEGSIESDPFGSLWFRLKFVTLAVGSCVHLRHYYLNWKHTQRANPGPWRFCICKKNF